MSRCLLSKNSFVNIQPFMVINLGLDGASLIIYALIYGHTVNKGVFYGSLEYIAQWCHCSTRNVISCVNSLIEKGLIRRRKTSRGTFYISEEVDTELPRESEEDIENPFSDEERSHEKSSGKSEKSSHGEVKKVHKNDEKSSPNNLDNNIVDKLDINSKSHCEPFSPNEPPDRPSCSPQSEPFPEQDKNSKSHCGKATAVSEEFKNQVQQVKTLYLNNYHALFESRKVSLERPQVIWGRAVNKIKECVRNFGFESVMRAMTLALDDSWLVGNGYVITTILSDSVMARLLQSAGRKPSQRSCPQPRQWSTEHLIL